MKLYLDSSAFAKRFVEEPGSREVEDLCAQAEELCLSVICVPEIISALNRRLREKALTRAEYARTKRRLSEDVRDAFIVNLTPAVVQTCVAVLEASPVRTIDAVHIASAIEWHADLFVSADHRQTAAAGRAGLGTRRI